MQKKPIKKIVFISLLVIFVVLLIFQLGILITNGNLSLESVIYWIILLLWADAVWYFKLRESYTFILAFILFVISAIFSIFGLFVFSEVIMRISFIGWVIGMIQAIAIYKSIKRKA